MCRIIIYIYIYISDAFLNLWWFYSILHTWNYIVYHHFNFLTKSINLTACQEQGFRCDASITGGVEPTRARRAARSDATKAERSSDWPVSRGVRIKWLMRERAGVLLYLKFGDRGEQLWDASPIWSRNLYTWLINMLVILSLYKL